MSGAPPNPYAPPHAIDRPPQTEPTTTAGPRGIGGWLVLCLIGLVAWAISYVIGLHGLVVHLDAVSARLASGNPIDLARIPLALIDLVMIIVAVVWMVRHDRRFPKLFIAHTIVQIILFGVVAWQDPRSGVSTETVLVLIVRALVWFNYFSVSERVENTFVR